MQKSFYSRSQSGGKSRPILLAALVILIVTLWFGRHLLYTTWTLAALRVFWHDSASDFILSESHDNFDVSFANYSTHQVSAEPYEDLVPPVLHHIALGDNEGRWKGRWGESVQSCIDIHPGWESHIWTDENASQFVADKFPELKELWDNYHYPVQRIDALRYMLLYAYGGVILDMDLKCKRALGPLRRFSFVAPEAHPTGFSIGFMMANKGNAFVGNIVRNLTVYNRQWLGLPYATVMFSTGCHFASVVHVYESDRSNLKILPGPLHSLNGRVSTPIFDHLGSSSWHSYDAKLIVTIGSRINLVFFFFVGIALALFLRRKSLLRRC
ncbi:Glycosyltransferase, DXD sugar-binding motif protein [Metarhizium rileyi]|uniref:Glycosyltransferase, DXD sugar-binding motif protein n=1 Tax=Metarhizium rileyi (strain RCEF 4871) TaxID=1649241 RepID=A0A166VXR1_METRR|nr:Glycosyltransferase, DXD sugar-binding motif protein [Metarhizium rileyi RCEF 4871]